MIVAQLQSDSIGARAGLRAGDRHQTSERSGSGGSTDWQRVRVHLDPSKPLELEIERARSVILGEPVAPVRAERMAVGPGPAGSAGLSPGAGHHARLRACRRIQALTLNHPPCSVRCSSPPLPRCRWRSRCAWSPSGTPCRPLLGALLWLPFATSVAVGPLLFAFFAVFPRRVLVDDQTRRRDLPGGAHRRLARVRLVSHLAGSRTANRAAGLDDGVFVINVIYAGLAVALLLAHRRAAETLTDQRRIRVLIVGAVVGVAAGTAVVVGYWRNPGTDIFATRTLTVFSLVFLAMPASFAYAILRHRLFDVSLIVRQGLRYALARRFVDALIPMLGALLLVDVIMHRDQPLVTMLSRAGGGSRWSGVALLVVRAYREDWLRSVDRRFFRERYDAQRLLRSIAEQITRASNFDAIAPSVMQQIDEALHPEFVSVLRHAPERIDVRDRSQPASAAERAPAPLPASLAVIGVLSVLRKPLALSLGDTAWVRHQLPIEERALLRRARHRAARSNLQPALRRSASRTARARSSAFGRTVQPGGSRSSRDHRARSRTAARTFVGRSAHPGRVRQLRALLRRWRRSVLVRSSAPDDGTRFPAAQRSLPPRAPPRPRWHGRGLRSRGRRPRTAGRGETDPGGCRGSPRPRCAASDRKRARPRALRILTSSASTISASTAINGHSW